MRKLLFLFLIFFAFLEAKMVDGIAMIVEGQAITMAEIRSLKSQMGISKAEAVDLLIQDRLQNVAMKDIVIPEEEIDTKISEIAAQNHIYGTSIPIRFSGETTLGVTIGKNSLISANVVILDGICIGDKSVIGAGSVVAKDIQSNCLAYGVPCKKIKDIDI
ncbi:MAG: hypothetical protein DSZ12_02605, partial [Sulfurovum sp.]